MTILFYSPFNNRSRDTESLMLAFKAEGHRVISLSQAEGKYIHPFIETKGIEAFSHVITGRKGVLYYLRHIVYFISFCKKQKVDVVYAHLESSNFVAAIAQYFVRAKVFICRHHIDEASLQGFDKSVYYKLTYKLAKKIIVVSNRAVEFMVEHEKVNKNKILKINLAYDFSLYTQPDKVKVAEIKAVASTTLLLISVSRLTKYKRINLSIDVLDQLTQKGVDAKLIILGSGEELDNLTRQVELLNLQNRVIMPGYVQNVADYLDAADFLLHPSVLESSCVIVKEAGLVNKPVIVCKDVGDFDEYIVDNENGFVVNKNNFVDESVACILESFGKQETLHRMGKNLNENVHRLFSIQKNIVQYKKLNTRE